MQFKSLGEQIEFFLNPDHLDLHQLQKSFQTMIGRYYRAKLTSRTLFSLQDPISKIEELCEIIRLISNKKAIKQCKEGIKQLETLLEIDGQNYQIIKEKPDEIKKLADAINTVCKSKLNRAVLSEFENDDESRHYFSYDVCNTNVNSFKANKKIKLVNKLFLVRQSGNTYTYWIFGAHVNYKKPDDTLIISAAKNDNFNTITLNKERGMLYYNETTLFVDPKQDALLSYKLTHYDNESNAVY